MPCPTCGSPEGSVGMLCPGCVADFKSQHQARRKEILFHKPKEDLIHGVTTDWRVQLGGLIVLICALFLFFLFFGPVKSKGTAASFLFACMAANFFVSALTWTWFWVKMVVHEIMWAIGAIFVPCLVYRYVYLNWQETKVPFVIHFLCGVLSFVFAALLGARLEISMFETLFLFNKYIYGFDVPIMDGTTY